MKTMREKELEDALAVAIEFIVELMGSDAEESEVVEHLINVFERVV
jgi:hypothetical protein